MKQITALVLIYFAMLGAAVAQKQPTGVTYDATIIRVSDGDTIVIAAPYLPQPLKPELAVRIFGVDTPEKGHRAQCASENERGQAATEYAQKAVAAAKKIQVVLYRWDKFGGRVLGDILLDGRSHRTELIGRGFAREYYGDAKQSWCP